MLPPELRTLVKDTLRGARFAVRHSLRSSALPGVLSRTQIGVFADNVMSTLEGGVLTNLESAGLNGVSVSDALDDLITLQACQQRSVFSARFQSDYYALTKSILRACGVENAYICEHYYSIAARKLNVKANHTVAKFFSLATLAAISAGPVRFLDRSPSNLNHPVAENPNAFAAFCVGLAATAYSLSPDTNPEECLEGAIQMVAVTFPTLIGKVHNADADAALEQLYAEFAGMLP